MAAVQAELAALPLEDLQVPDAMPIMDAIGLAKFMVDTATNCARFRLGTDTVGGLTEIASVTRHEGFKWVQRKHYYGPELNPHNWKGRTP